MIDVENEVFTRVKKKLVSTFGDSIVCDGSYSATPASFPAMTLVMMDNSAYEKTQDSGSLERHAQVMFEANAYSNATSGKKMQCKKIMSLVDTEMLSMGFSRTMLNPVPNLNDATIYRMTARYSGVVAQNKTIYRR